MSKIVVGMNSRPAIMPHRIDCGLRNTMPSAPPALVEPVVGLRALRLLLRQQQRTGARLIDEPGDAHPDPEAVPGHAARRSRARPRTGRPIRRPCRTSAWRRSASRRARRESSWWRCRRRRPARRRRPRPAGSGRRSRASRCPGEQQRPDADRRRADGHDRARPQAIHRHAGDQAERRVAVVEEPDQRRDADGAEAERRPTAAASSPPAPSAARTGRSSTPP